MVHEYMEDNKKSLILNKIKYGATDTLSRYKGPELASLNNKAKEALHKSLAKIITDNLYSIRNDDYFNKNPEMITNTILEIRDNIEKSHGVNAGKIFMEAAETSLSENGLNTVILKGQ